MRAQENPFRSECVIKIKYKFTDTDMEGILEKIRIYNYRCALVGPEGSGKTTLLEEIEEHLEKSGFFIKKLILNTHSPVLKEIACEISRTFFSKNEILLIDGAEQIPLFLWFLLKLKSKLSGGCIITSHKKNMLPTLLECKTNYNLFINICQELAGKSVMKYDKQMEAAFKKGKGNLRLALMEMYALFSDL